MEVISLIIVSVVFVLLLKLTGKSRKAKLIDQLPGPPGVPLFGNAFQFVGVDRSDRLAKVMERDRKYGPIYRTWIVGLPFVHVTTAELAETVLNLRNTSKGQIYTFLRSWIGLGLLTSDGETWARSRKLITPTFHFQILEGYIDVFRKNGENLINKLRKHADTGVPVDLYPFFTLASLDSICETAMGTTMNAQDNAESAYTKAVYEILRLIFHRYDRFWLHSDWAWNLSPTGKEAKKNLEILNSFTENVIRERKLARKKAKLQNIAQDSNSFEGKRKKVFIDLLLDECESQEAGFTDVQLRDEVSTFMFEGHDTTTATMCIGMLQLADHPDIQEEIYQEQVSLYGTSKDAAPSIADLNSMNLLDRFIKETLRHNPAVPLISRTLKEDTKIGGYLIPQGTVIMTSLATILQDPRYFPDPKKFDPDRFLPENSLGRHSYANIPFSAGPRNCIGQRFAMFEAKVFLSYLIRNFRIEKHVPLEKCKLVIEVIQKPMAGIMVKLVSRNTK